MAQLGVDHPSSRATISGSASTSAARVEVDDAGAQRVAAADHRVRDEHFAAALQPIEQRAVERVEMAARALRSPSVARRSRGT